MTTTTADLIDSLINAVELLANDHQSRLGRIDKRRQFVAVKEHELLRAVETMRSAIDRLEETIRIEFQELDTLETDELVRTAEEDKPARIEPPKKAANGHFEQLLGNGKAKGS